MPLVRRLMLELWAILVVSGVVAFLGPFGTYLMGDYLSRFWHWYGLMTGAYLTMRPIMLLLRRLARIVALPPSAIVFWGMVSVSFPLALLWRVTSEEQTNLLGGYAGLLSFTLLCAGTVGTVTWWAGKADLYLQENAPGKGALADSGPPDRITQDNSSSAGRPQLYGRLSPGFEGEIIALQSEDHYVRIHGTKHSELVLMRLRDAIMELDGDPGTQVHRSWWVALSGADEVKLAGPRPVIRLKNGIDAPVARTSIERVRRSIIVAG